LSPDRQSTGISHSSRERVDRRGQIQQQGRHVGAWLIPGARVPGNRPARIGAPDFPSEWAGTVLTRL